MIVKKVAKKVIREIYMNFNKGAAKAIVTMGKVSGLADADRKYWLIGAYGGRAYSDNSSAFFEYLLRNHRNKKVYWVINRNSPDLEKVKRTNQYVYRGSIKANIMSLLAEVHVASHGLTDISEYKIRNFPHVFKVYLNHGVVGFKQYTNDAIKNQYDLFVANSSFDKSIMTSDWGIAAKKVKVTGMPRLDQMMDTIQAAKEEKQGGKKILYMPTWREWESESSILDSRFFTELDSFIQNPDLHKVLLEKDYHLNIYIHINFWRFKQKFKEYEGLPHIHILPLDGGVQKELTSSDLLITDYSSVAWDFLYLNKKVLFFQPDLASYEQHRTSYVDLRNDLFGKSFSDGQSLAQAIREIMDEKDEENETSKRRAYWRSKAFKFQDTQNSDRVFNSIIENLN